MIKPIIMCLVLLAVPVSSAGRQSDDDAWAAWRFLVGEWTGEGGGQPGQASSGGFSFGFDLQGQVLVRRSRAEYAATKDKPAYVHDDLMVIYKASAGKETRAIYFDNEGHVVNYTVTFSRDQNTLTFLSDPVASAPRFRFIYNKVKEGVVSFEFDIAPPGKPDSFSKYIEGSARRSRTPS